MVARSSAALFAIVALTSPPQPSRTFVTVLQKDKGRSLASMASVDISADGRYVAFESYARLVPADIDNQRDIYLFDRAAGQVTLESGMFAAQTDASHGRVSADARWLVFEAEALTDPTVPVRIEIVVIDRSLGTTRQVRAADGSLPNGSCHAPEISDDGRTVVFASVATNLVAEADANGQLEDIYALDVASGMVRRISIDSEGKQPSTGFSFSPSINADGRIIAFTSSAPLTDAAVREGLQHADARRFGLRQVYVRDQKAGTTSQISVTESGVWPDGASVRPAVSGDGRFVTFSSEATRLVKDDNNRASDIFVHDRQSKSTRLVSRTADGRAANGRSMAPTISFDGRFVAFQSEASNLVCAKRCHSDDVDVNLLWDVFVWDGEEDRIARASEDYLGGWMEPSIGPALDAHGTVVAFASRHATDSTDQEGDFDLFVRELPDPETTLVRRRER
jgi:Tol biopolymer transport system component